MAGFADRLIERAQEKKSRVIVGLDPALEHFPSAIRSRLRGKPTEEQLEEALFVFNRVVVEATEPYAVAYKPQAAFYEQYGMAGMRALQRTLTFLRQRGVLTIIDAKRNDVSHTARAYAAAWLAPTHPVLGTVNQWQSDAITLNGYLGRDGIDPFLEANPDAGVFVLAKTSNPSSKDLQDLLLGSGETVAEKMAALAQSWGADTLGYQGYANVGLVVGATYPEVAAKLREIAPTALFLMPGIGPQGGSLEAIVAGAGQDGVGAYAASSRGVMYPFDPSDLSGPDWEEVAMKKIERAASQLRQSIQDALDKRGGEQG